MNLENEQIESGVQSEPSPEVQESQSAEQTPSEPAKAASEDQQNQDSTPFHKHPRWIERDNELKAERQARQALEQRINSYESRLAELSKPSQAQKEQDALIARLKGIDPEFGERIERLQSSTQDVAELKERLGRFEAEQARSQAVSTVMSLHSQNKVPAELQELYNEQLEAMYSRNPKAFLSDVQGQYNSIHEKLSKVIDSIKRSTTASYVADKKADAKAPTTPTKGKAVSPSKDEEFSSDPAEAKAQLIKRVLNQARENRGL